MASAGFEAEVVTLARRIAELGADQRSRLLRSSWWNGRMLEWAMSHPSFKTQLFRFVDVFPAMTDDADVLRHLDEYFESAQVPKVFDLGMGVATHVPFGPALSASLARRSIARMAGQFIAGTSSEQAVQRLQELWRRGSAFTVDLLGEKTVTEREADAYAERVGQLLDVLVEATRHWAPDDHLERDDSGRLPRVNVSVKPTALAPHYSPLTSADGLGEARGRLMPILRRAVTSGAHVHLDMEHYEVKDLTLELFGSLATDPEIREAHLGIVVQAYLRDSYTDLAEIVSLSGSRDRGIPLTVRLVKGAYWDTETVLSRAHGWPVPVYENKAETDANFERCTRYLHDHHGEVRAAFGTHNLRSLAHAIAYARSVGIPDTGYECQMLYGMAEPIHAAIRRMGLRLRVYAPVGELVPGMAYLVRRLLENTSNESFVRQRFVERRSVEELAGEPVARADPEDVPSPIPAVRVAAVVPYRPEPTREWRRRGARAGFATAVGRAAAAGEVAVPALIDGRERATKRTIRSVDPASPSRTVAVSASCGVEEAEMAISAARRARPEWRRTPVPARAAMCFRVASWMRTRRDELAGLEVIEAGKPWSEADADVCEAIDFCEYYGREMMRLAQGGRVQSPPGEANRLDYEPRGIGAVIAPWNFPLAIPTGMVMAGLVTGNAVLFKPAEQTPAVAWRLVEALRWAGLPDGVLGFLPGPGEELGAHLVVHPEVSFVTFTGSRSVGLGIVESGAAHREGQRHVRRIVAEMGGKNPLIVDDDADLDQAVPIAVSSAFGYSGQKCSACSRLIVLDPVFDQMVERLVGAAAGLRIGHPAVAGVELGPLIDAEARQRVLSYMADAPSEGEVVLAREDVPSEGWFVGPTIVADVSPEARVAREEIFGPVLCVLRARDLEHAVELANDTDYGLTAGIVSRSPAHIRWASAELRAGNVYVNRPTTGAVVGRQPFGGVGLSGVGSKAGGPDYLLQFLDPKLTSENTLRQGFAPSEESP
ncbi:MAG: proline dehydrogenase family protein [Acidimicrobiales bacterium]